MKKNYFLIAQIDEDTLSHSQLFIITTACKPMEIGNVLAETLTKNYGRDCKFISITGGKTVTEITIEWDNGRVDTYSSTWFVGFEM